MPNPRLIAILCLSCLVLITWGCRTAPRPTHPREESLINKVVVLDAVFKALDKNRDGRLSPQEYDLLWRNKQKASLKFDASDSDGNGYLTPTEFKIPLLKMKF